MYSVCIVYVYINSIQIFQETPSRPKPFRPEDHIHPPA